MRQFHSEFKTDMDLERWPFSGKLIQTNLVCQLAAVSDRICLRNELGKNAQRAKMRLSVMLPSAATSNGDARDEFQSASHVKPLRSAGIGLEAG